jgi:hypothetical protein
MKLSILPSFLCAVGMALFSGRRTNDADLGFRGR